MTTFPKPRWPGRYYIWQVESYGKDYYIADLPCEIIKYRPMPATPAGDLLAAVPTARQALDLLAVIDGMSFDDAQVYVREALKVRE